MSRFILLNVSRIALFESSKVIHQHINICRCNTYHAAWYTRINLVTSSSVRESRMRHRLNTHCPHLIRRDILRERQRRHRCRWCLLPRSRRKEEEWWGEAERNTASSSN